MICTLLKPQIRLLCRSFLRFLDRSLSRVMGCFFGCFRITDDDHRRRRRPNFVSDSSPSIPNEAATSRNRLSSLFQTEEAEENAYSDMKNLCAGSPQINKELVDEAKFLKACGTLTETPAEIRKASKKLKGSPPFGNDSKSSDFHSWLLHPSVDKLQYDKPSTPTKLYQVSGNVSASPGHSLSSCISTVQNTGRISISSIEDGGGGSVKTSMYGKNVDITPPVSQRPSDTNVPYKKKSVHFECNLDTSSKGSSAENEGKFQSHGDLSVSKLSPKPTPIKISDEMQTPGTVFPANVDIIENRKLRIRSQYVYSVSDPVENESQWKVIEEDDCNSYQPGSLKPLSVGVEEDSSVGELNAEVNESGKNYRLHRTPADRPIIGLVATHWNENEASHISPKWWDGNGIPNSTNKYKEDQKVSWHATPFEERLEKALSEESVVSQTKHVDGRPIALDEHDESDTALSSATYSKPLVSC